MGGPSPSVTSSPHSICEAGFFEKAAFTLPHKVPAVSGLAAPVRCWGADLPTAAELYRPVTAEASTEDGQHGSSRWKDVLGRGLGAEVEQSSLCAQIRILPRSWCSPGAGGGSHLAPMPRGRRVTWARCHLMTRPSTGALGRLREAARTLRFDSASRGAERLGWMADHTLGA